MNQPKGVIIGALRSRNVFYAGYAFPLALNFNCNYPGYLALLLRRPGAGQAEPRRSATCYCNAYRYANQAGESLGYGHTNRRCLANCHRHSDHPANQNHHSYRYPDSYRDPDHDAYPHYPTDRHTCAK